MKAFTDCSVQKSLLSGTATQTQKATKESSKLKNLAGALLALPKGYNSTKRSHVNILQHAVA